MGWSQHGWDLYKIVFQKNSLDGAQEYCWDISSKLVQVDTMEENQFLYSLLDTNDEIFPDSEYWVGNKLGETEVSDWGDTGPTSEECIVLGKEGGRWVWRSAGCMPEVQKYFICEKPVTNEQGKYCLCTVS